MAEYKQTTKEHPTKKLWVARRSGRIQLGNGKVLDVRAGDHARASDTYEGQAGPTKLFAPTGNHSKFALSPQTVNKFYKPAASGEQLNFDLRDERGTKDNVQTGGRRSPEEIASAGKPKSKKSRQDDQQDSMRIDKQSENEPMRLAAGDQYDTQDADNLIEQLCALDDDQLDEFLDTLSDEQVQVIEQFIEESRSKLVRAIKSGEKKGKDTTELQKKLDRKSVVRRWQQGTLGDSKTDVNVQQRMGAKSGRGFGATETLSRLKTTPAPQKTDAEDRDQKLQAFKALRQHSQGKTPDTGQAEQQVRRAQQDFPELSKYFVDKRLGQDGETADGETADGETADGETADNKTAGGKTKVSHKRGRPGEVYLRSLYSQQSQGTARGPGGDESRTFERGARSGVVDGGEQETTPQTHVGPGLKSRVRSATSGVRVPSRKLAQQARTIGASVEHDNNLDQIQENEEQQMNNYVETAINGDAINFSSTIRDALDAHAHAAIEQIKTSMLESDDTQDQDGAIDEQVEAIVEQLEQLDEQQLEQYLGELNEQELLQIEQLLDEAERGRAVAAAAMWKRLGGKKSK